MSRTDQAGRTPALQAIIDFFEGICPADIARIGEIYSPQAWFKDPFNEVRGSAAIGRIFSHMFEQVRDPRFVVHDCVGGEREVFLTWDFIFQRAGGATLTVRGASHLRLDDQGRIEWHRDYWDTGEELYGKLPLIGPLMRWLRRQGAAPAAGSIDTIER
jgi:steroid delta-isomerase